MTAPEYQTDDLDAQLWRVIEETGFDLAMHHVACATGQDREPITAAMYRRLELLDHDALVRMVVLLTFQSRAVRMFADTLLAQTRAGEPTAGQIAAWARVPCQICGVLTHTPPICLRCDVAEDAAAERRADR